MDTVTITLSAPVKAFGKDIQELTLRGPNGKDIRECGFPFFNFVDANKNRCDKIDTGSIAKYIKNLSSPPITANTVDQLTPADFINCTNAVAGFFPQTEKTDEVS